MELKSKNNKNIEHQKHNTDCKIQDNLRLKTKTHDKCLYEHGKHQFVHTPDLLTVDIISGKWSESTFYFMLICGVGLFVYCILKM